MSPSAKCTERQAVASSVNLRRALTRPVAGSVMRCVRSARGASQSHTLALLGPRGLPLRVGVTRGGRGSSRWGWSPRRGGEVSARRLIPKGGCGALGGTGLASGGRTGGCHDRDGHGLDLPRRLRGPRRLPPPGPAGGRLNRSPPLAVLARVPTRREGGRHLRPARPAGACRTPSLRPRVALTGRLPRRAGRPPRVGGEVRGRDCGSGLRGGPGRLGRPGMCTRRPALVARG